MHPYYILLPKVYMEHLHKGKYRGNYCGIQQKEKKASRPSWSVVKSAYDLPPEHKYAYTLKSIVHGK